MFRKSVRERSWQRGKGTQQLTLGGWGKRVDEHTADPGPDVRTPPRHPHEEQPEEREVSDAHSAQGTEIKGFKFAKEELLIGFRADAGLVTSLSVSPCGVKLFSQKSPSLIISKKGWEHIQSQRKYYFSQNTHTCTHACTHTDEMRERKPIFLVGCIRTREMTFLGEEITAKAHRKSILVCFKQSKKVQWAGSQKRKIWLIKNWKKCPSSLMIK